MESKGLIIKNKMKVKIIATNPYLEEHAYFVEYEYYNSDKKLCLETSYITEDAAEIQDLF